jgi:hypothetical protein
MWLMLNKSFLSIVDPDGHYAGGGPKADKLLVRARIAGDIEAVFPKARVQRTEHRDYLFRALIDRHTVAEAMVREVMNLDYHNFKGSTKAKWRHDDYMKVWHVMNNAQMREDRGAKQQAKYDAAPKAGKRQFSRGVVVRDEFDDFDGGQF